MPKSVTSKTVVELPPEDGLSPQWFAEVRRRATAWYADAARDLPWRGTRDPYAIWVSEIMLQQTTVAAVRPKFARFLEKFPDVSALAAAEESAVLRQWEGLGYYRRARQLHAAAKTIVAEHAGRFPAAVAAIRALSGIGRYTAGAIASIAYDLPEPILEANTVRLWARLLGETGEVTHREVQERLWNAASAVLPNTGGSGLLNQALMDLGSQVCVPRGPLCLLCPLSELCHARKSGLTDVIPTAAKKTVWTHRHEAALLIERRGKTLMIRYAPGARWAGMWDVPRTTLTIGQPIPQAKKLLTETIADEFEKLLGVSPTLGIHATRMKHVVTRYKITLDVLQAEITTRAKSQFDQTKLSEMAWIENVKLSELPMSTTAREIVSKLVSLKKRK